MLERYFSKNTCYYFDDCDDLIVNKNGKEKNWGKAVYVSKDEFEKALEEHQIPPKKGYQIRKPIADSFLKYLRGVEMNRGEKGGRFVTLIEDENDLLNESERFFTMKYIGKILKIESINLNLE